MYIAHSIEMLLPRLAAFKTGGRPDREFPLFFWAPRAVYSISHESYTRNTRVVRAKLGLAFHPSEV